MDGIDLRLGDSCEVLKTLPENSIDAVVTDPPYHLTSIVKRFGGKNSAPAQFGTDGAFARASRGFMGKEWDGGDIAFRPEFWAEVWRVLKPGGHLLAFSGSRTYHRMAVGIEDAGFEIRDQIMWLYGSGFPKSHDVSKGIDRAAGAEREVIGHDTKARSTAGSSALPTLGGETEYKSWNITAPATEAAKQWQGWGSALKPAHEPIVVARKPLVGTIAENVLTYGTGALNIDGCRVPTDGADAAKHRAEWDRLQSASQSSRATALSPAEQIRLDGYAKDGRWPANVIHDGSDEVVAGFPADGDKSAARFFYCAKASKRDRDEGLEGFEAKQYSHDGREKSIENAYQRNKSVARNIHPTVKPTDLMRYLCRLVTPPGGLVLDPFMGSGSTGKAARLEGFRFIGIERESDYFDIARARIAAARGVNDFPEQTMNSDDVEARQLPLFAE